MWGGELYRDVVITWVIEGNSNNMGSGGFRANISPKNKFLKI